MAKIGTLTIVAAVLFTSSFLTVIGVETNLSWISLFTPVLMVVTLEQLSHIAAVSGILATIWALFLTYRKNLLNTGFANFQSLYQIEMADFKKTVRDYINVNDDRHAKAMESIAQIQVQTLNKISNLEKMQAVLVENRRIITAKEQEWKQAVENDLEKLDGKITDLTILVKTKVDKIG